MRALLISLLLIWAIGPADAAEGPPANRTEVFILGVDHSAQLINRRQQPAAMRAFFEALAPDAICIERSPDRVARNDHYEFTYEIQEVIVPWAREKRIALCPFDWLPNAEDSALALGIADLEAVPPLRRPSGFQGFLTFPEARSRTLGLFFADAPEERARHRDFYAAYPSTATRDFPRRLFLYRTYMQAQRIAAAARNHPGGRILVVVGMMHKDDIEAILADAPHVRVIQPSALASEPDAAAVARLTRTEDLAAIASFNLLGVQWRDPLVDRGWMAEVVARLQQQSPGPEADLLATRLAELEGADPRALLGRYREVAAAAGDRRFTWTGVKDQARLDSFYDPFGNLTVGDRAWLEAARLHLRLGERRAADRIRRRLATTLASEGKRQQFDGYWTRYIDPAEARGRAPRATVR